MRKLLFSATKLLFIGLLTLLFTFKFFRVIPALNPSGLVAIAQNLDNPASTPPIHNAPLFSDLGDYSFPISTRFPLAQRYFDQGLILAYGFNHAEAARSFRAVTEIDPNAAMGYWGLALVLGPNINAPMDAQTVNEAWQAVQKALSLIGQASDREQAYIQALAQRYSPDAIAERRPLDLAYAQAMGEVAQRYVEDLDAATLYAEALMDTTPWDYWQDNGDPKPAGKIIIDTLEDVLAKNPKHPGANHFYIHAVEKERPELGTGAADRLWHLVPGAGHLVHMPSHIYIRVGRYADAVLSNQQAIAADNAYLSQCHASGLYPLGYRVHNHHFLWFAALMTGQSQIAIAAAEETGKVAPALLRNPYIAGIMQHFYAIALYTYTRFGQWERIQSIAQPAADLQYPTGVWHYARGMAAIAQGQVKPAQQALQSLQAIASDPATAALKIGELTSASQLLAIASEVLAGEIAAQQGQFELAIAHVQRAIATEDNLTYTEPAAWYHPTRQILGALHLQAQHPADAEQAYRADLKNYPDNGWSLSGLAESLQQQGKTQEADSVRQRFKVAWDEADVAATASLF